ncbi:cyclin-Y-like protein 1 [Pipistrellus kuhlii]|nr:cyclin-Y-like protein 1 [Pipistrellus kuhlii]
MVHGETSEDTGTVETMPATPESEKMESGRLNSLALRGYNRQNISDPVMDQEQDVENNDDFPGHLMKRHRSFPTVFLYDNTVSQPDFSFILQALGDRSADIFDERKHPFKHKLSRKTHMSRDPELHVIYRFVCDLFSAEHLTAECAIVTLIYLERIKHYIKAFDVCPTNWKRLLLAAAIVAYELWDKQAVWSVPFCQLVNNIITFDDMIEIEMHFLNYIHFDTDVSASLYAKYYFDLRYLVHENNPLVLVKSFCKEIIQSTEAISRGYQKKDLSRASIKRSLSADNVIGMQHIKAMLTKENEGL